MWNTKLFALLALSVGPSALYAQGNAGERQETPAEKARHATALVVASDEPTSRGFVGLGQGTGFLVDQRRKLLVTCTHVVNQAATVRVSFPLYNGTQLIRDPKHYRKYDRPIRGWVVARDHERDVAVIELETVPHTARELTLASTAPRRGDPIALVGHPGDSELLWVPSAGKVLQAGTHLVKHSLMGPPFAVTFVNFDALGPVRRGNSGAALVNAKGEVVGMAATSNAFAQDFTLTLQALRGILLSWHLGPVPALPLLGYEPGARPVHLVGAVGVREVEDVLRLYRGYPQVAARYLNPQTAADFRERGYYYHEARPDYALAAYTEALAREPGHAVTVRSRGALLARQGKHTAALADLNQALKLNPDDASAYRERGIVHHQQGRLDRALADLSAALRLDPRNARAYWWRSKAHAARGEAAQARADADRAVHLDPSLRETSNKR